MFATRVDGPRRHRQAGGWSASTHTPWQICTLENGPHLLTPWRIFRVYSSEWSASIHTHTPASGISLSPMVRIYSHTLANTHTGGWSALTHTIWRNFRIYSGGWSASTHTHSRAAGISVPPSDTGDRAKVREFESKRISGFSSASPYKFHKTTSNYR